jgi:hypothetical protein
MTTTHPKMNASRQCEVASSCRRIAMHGAVLGADYMARGLSALYRSAMRESQQRAILAFALAYPVRGLRRPIGCVTTPGLRPRLTGDRRR